jgi:hypothetical protein
MQFNQEGKRSIITFFKHGIDFNIGFERYAALSLQIMQ